MRRPPRGTSIQYCLFSLCSREQLHVPSTEPTDRPTDRPTDEINLLVLGGGAHNLGLFGNVGVVGAFDRGLCGNNFSGDGW